MTATRWQRQAWREVADALEEVIARVQFRGTLHQLCLRLEVERPQDRPPQLRAHAKVWDVFGTGPVPLTTSRGVGIIPKDPRRVVDGLIRSMVRELLLHEEAEGLWFDGQHFADPHQDEGLKLEREPSMTIIDESVPADGPAGDFWRDRLRQLEKGKARHVGQEED